MDCRSRADVDRVMRVKIIPLLSEYFYENWEKMRHALGETTDSGAFIARTQLSAPSNSNGAWSEEGRWRYSVRSEFAADAYEQLKA
jgi:5-methylcytosine-specific restriction protein B